MGERLGKYELFSKIASGGMAEIHVAKSSTLGVDKVVVIKRLLPQHLSKPEFVEMFLDEARIAAALNHPNIVQMYDFGPVDGAYFMAMEYLHGADLRSIHRQAVANHDLLPLKHVMTIMSGVCSGLHHAHDAKGMDGVPLEVVHRDVSPHNVVITFDGAVKLVDFGIAKAKNRKSETRHGTLKGKVPYMSPEQLRGEPIDRRCDVYALGVILYELTTGQRPYIVTNTGEFALMMAIARGQIKAPSLVRPDYPRELEQIVTKAMARRSADRYQTTRELEMALETFAARNKLQVSVNALAGYMSTVFSERIERWGKARAAGKAFAEHVAELELERAHTEADDDDSDAEIVDTTEMNFQVEWDEDAPGPPASTSGLSGMIAAGVDIAARHVGAVEVVALSGRLTESFTGAAVGAAMRGVVVIDLANVDRVTSFGVREWLEMMNAARSGVTELYLARLSEAIATQMGMIRSFAGPGKVASFHAPYLCDACGSSFRWLIDCERDGDALKNKALPPGKCPTCGNEGHLDDDEGYCAFAIPYAGVPISAPVRAALDTLADAEASSAGDVVEKLVVGNVTRLRVRGTVDRSVRWKRVLDGLEGAVVLDFQSPKVDSGASGGLAQALAAVGPEVTSIEIQACPLGVFEAIGAAPRAESLKISTVTLEGMCPSCNAGRSALVELTDLEASMRLGTPIKASCRRCNGALVFDADLEKRVRRSLGKVSEPPSVRARSSRPVAARAAGASAGAKKPYVVVAVVGALVLAGVVAIASRPSATPGGSGVSPGPSTTVDPTMPAWAKLPVSRESGSVVLVGVSGPVETEREGLELAQADAIRRLVGAVLTEMPEGPVKAYAMSQSAGDTNRPMATPELLALASRFVRLVGTTATPERVDVAVKRLGERVQIYARYSLAEEGFRSAVSAYSRAVKLNGLTVATLFPLVAGPADQEHDLVVVQVDGAARARGLAVGDRVLGVDGKPAQSLQSFSALTTKSKSYSLLVESGGVSKNVQLAH